jgi:muramoyltetrapeptide carboxypeptidase
VIQEIHDPDQPVLCPAPLQPGDRVRFVSPASTPDKEGVWRRARILESWGLRVDFGDHAFDERGYLAGCDEYRLADFNEALRDPEIRAIFATRGGKGSYRIASKLDFAAAQRDPKFVVGFSDITALHLSLWKRCRLIGIHGALVGADDEIAAETIQALRASLMTTDNIVLKSENAEPTSVLTTSGEATGVLLGGSFGMVATAAGWALPDLAGAILLLEAVNMAHGQVDRHWTMLSESGFFEGLEGVVFGQFFGFRSHGSWTVFDYLQEHLDRLNVPVLGGLPLGHGECPRATPIGAMAHMDASAGVLTVMPRVTEFPEKTPRSPK